MAKYEINNVPSNVDFECNDDILKRTLQNCKNLLMTRMGEIPYDRYRGFDPALLNLPLTKLRYELMPELDRVFLWEPDATVYDARATMDRDGNTIITVILEINV